MITVLLADDQPSVRRSLAILLERAGDISVIAQAGSGPEAVALAAQHRPDVVLMDIRMPGGDGLSATAALAGPHADPAIPVVVITTFDLDEYVFGALERGAAGFLLKDAAPHELADAVRAAAAGDGLVSPAVTRRVIREFARRSPPPDSSLSPEPPLTERERDVLRALSEGLSNAEISARLFVEVGTVKTHVSRIIAKLGVRDRVQAVVWTSRHPGWDASPSTPDERDDRAERNRK
ncbi:response regulator transcription factor [Leucobacter sp. CSA2]|uniref:Response regulator transcription factor n=1 Tax=Leucobacter edaphi TaxID=2796472 RepID=A0A934QCS2_9MICO|nr:response regulator transcription factor [Leucobacter edaphi]MBK0421828.1 response regulator transcription factor [Leucobacter edaphi]